MAPSWAIRKYGTIHKLAIFEERAVSLNDIIFKYAISESEKIFNDHRNLLEKNINDQVRLILKARLPA